MKRDIYNKLLEWKSSKRRKPLLMQGARQTGKTYILKEFGSREYKNCIYCNFEDDSELDHFFQRNLDPERIVSELSVYLKQDIKPHRDLIFFDEIQASDRALTALKYFQEKKNSFHIVAAGSLLGVKLSSSGSFPVGKVNFLCLYPMTFIEFLTAMNEDLYRQLLENIDSFTPIPEAFHNDLTRLLCQY